MIRLNRSKFGNWPSGPASRLANPRWFSPEGLMVGGGSSRYKIDYALRLRAANSANLTRTYTTTPTDRRKAFFSYWIKRGAITLTDPNWSGTLAYQDATGAGYPAFRMAFEPSGDGFTFRQYTSASTFDFNLVTTRQFRDVLGHAHIFVVYDSTQATASDRIKIWVNGVLETSFSSATYPALNTNIEFGNNSTMPSWIGAPTGGPRFFDGLLSHFIFGDGQTPAVTSCGQIDAASGQWTHKKYTGAYGNNGCLLEFKDATAATAAAIGKDTSGNGHNWTPSGISVTAGVTFDQSLDTPTNNHAKFSPLYSTNAPTYQNANERITWAGGAVKGSFVPFDLTTGLYYAEAINTTAAAGIKVGVGSTPGDPSQVYNVSGEADTGETNVNGFAYNSFNGTIRRNASTLATLASWNSSGDRIGIATRSDGTNLRIWLRKNGGSWLGTGSPNPATDTDPTVTITLNGPAYLFGSAANGGVLDLNTGQRAFVDTPPTGFKALNTANLSTPSIINPAAYFQAALRTGTGASASVSSLAFQPDLVWIKSRSNATDHNLFDSSRGVQKGIGTNRSGPEYTDANSLTAFNSNGYSLGSDGSSRGVNINTNTYVDWSWKEGSMPGFVRVPYTGNATNRTISHGLGAVPHFMIIKNLVGFNSWPVYHRNMNATPQNGSLFIDTTAAYAADATIFNSTAPTSSVFSVGTAASANGNTNGMIAYLWTSIPGFSLFGSYVGNGSADGPFVWCGFKPRWVMMKTATGTDGWALFDSLRSSSGGNNPVNSPLIPNQAAVEQAGLYPIDFLAGGFKPRDTNTTWNGSGQTYIFAAFAEAPFKFATAR